MVATIIGFSGVNGSGKTSIAHALCDRLVNSSVRSFGDTVRREAQARGRGLTREELQETGVDLIAEGWDPFVAMTLEPQPTTDILIVDGIRHLEAVRRIRARWPGARYLQVYIRPAQTRIDERLAARGEDPQSLAHQVEAELPSLLETADVVIVADDLTDNVQKILNAL